MNFQKVTLKPKPFAYGESSNQDEQVPEQTLERSLRVRCDQNALRSHDDSELLFELAMLRPAFISETLAQTKNPSLWAITKNPHKITNPRPEGLGLVVIELLGS